MYIIFIRAGLKNLEVVVMARQFRAIIIVLASIIAFFAADRAHAAETATEAMGVSKTVIASSPARIALLYPQAIGLFFILDLTEKIVCLPKRPAGLADGKLEEFYNTFAPSFSDVADAGQVGIPNIETILRTGPDLVVASLDFSHSGELTRSLEQHGIKTVTLHAGFGTVDEWLESVAKLAEVTGSKERAKKYTEFFKEKLALVSSRTADIPVEKRPKVAMINTSGNQMILRGSRTTYGFNLIRLAGGRLMNAGDDPADSAGCAELLFAFDPDLIIDDSKNDIFYKASWWDSLRAVKEGRVYKTPADDRQAWLTNWFLSTYSPVGILWLAKKFYPERFADIDLRAEHENFCRMLYGRPFAHAGTGFGN